MLITLSDKQGKFIACQPFVFMILRELFTMKKYEFVTLFNYFCFLLHRPNLDIHSRESKEILTEAFIQ